MAQRVLSPPLYGWNPLKRDTRVKVPANFPLAINISIEVDEGICKREIGFLQALTAAGDSGSISALIQSGPEVIDGVKNDAGKHFWNWFSEPELMDILSGGTRVRIDESGPWLFVEERINDRFEIANVMLCATEGELRALEPIFHERKT
jgi:hypothetical protein